MNLTLKMAIVKSGKRQIVLAREVGIHESRLSKIVNGHADATDDEKKAIAKALRRKVQDLFSEVAA